MEAAPPVPPKDTPRKSRPDLPHSSSVPTSASKRKREDHLVDTSASEDELARHTPKRHRMTPPQGDTDVSGSTSARRQSTLRRRKGVNNLSSLNLRHQAEQARTDEQHARESRFQEGSLTDKPSQKPPSAFTRIIRTDSGSLEHVDALMTDYHDGMPTPGESTDSSANAEATMAGAEQSSAFYRFGQRLASGFRPVALWNKIWNETKEELTQKNIEIELKRRQKLEAERQYARMKQAGQIPSRKTSTANFGSIAQRDPGMEMVDENSLSAFGPHLGAPREGAMSRADSQMNDGYMDGEKTLRSRMHFTRPSLSNLRLNLKRSRSDANMFDSSNRESSASASPVKAEGEGVEVHKSHSRAELKKQHKLSKRVSDLEMKLNIARKELGEALEDASPMPRFSGRYERFAPLSTVRRKFVPGGLPSLPSERLLDVEVMAQNMHSGAALDRGSEDEATIRASRAKPYPRRAADLFSGYEAQDMNELSDHSNNVGKCIPAMDPADNTNQLSSSLEVHESIVMPQATPPTSDDIPRDAADLVQTPASKKATAKPSKILSRNTKRKSGAFEDASNTPDGDKEHDDEPSLVKKSIKKRKSNIRSQTHASRPGPQSDEVLVGTTIEHDQTDLFQNYADELAQSSVGLPQSASVRLSIDSTTHSLEPVYEEEEGTTIVPLNNDPSQPTAVATPARFGCVTRSISPVKRSPVKAGAEEIVLTRAADAVKKHPARLLRSGSPDGKVDFEWPDDVF